MRVFATALFLAVAAAIRYDQYILTPSSRSLHPIAVFHANGYTIGSQSLANDSPGSCTFNNVSSVTYDYGNPLSAQKLKPD
jgi:hypothetical protein